MAKFGHSGPHPERTIREAFERFHADNPHVYTALVRLARQARRAGLRRVGMKMLFEVLRWDHAIRTEGDEFKLNNNYHAYYARLVMEQEADLAGMFLLRAQADEANV